MNADLCRMNVEVRPVSSRPAPWIRIALLGIAQILIWGGSFFSMAVLADPIATDTHWPRSWVYGCLSLALFISGLLAPAVGKQITRQKGKPLLLSSGLVVGTGLMITSVSFHIGLFVMGWCVIGIGMAMGLYDALFSVLGQQYGTQAKSIITQITLISGFCSTVIWPLLAWMVHGWGWQVTCFSYGLLLVVSIYPLYRLSLPATDPERVDVPVSNAESPVSTDITDRWLLRLLIGNFTIAAIIMTLISVQLISILQSQGLSLPAAIGLSTLIGPCQVGVRMLDLFIPPRHSIWTTLLSCVLTLLGLALLSLGPLYAMASVILYSLGNGMRSILRGTLPLDVFGSKPYANVIGQIARAALIAQSVTPLAGGFLLQRYGVSTLLAGLTGLALVNVGMTVWIKYRLSNARLDRMTI